MVDHGDTEAARPANAEHSPGRDEEATKPLTAQQLVWEIGFHEADKVSLQVRLRAAERRDLDVRYQTVLKRPIQGHDEGIAFLQGALRQKEIGNGSPLPK